MKKTTTKLTHRQVEVLRILATPAAKTIDWHRGGIYIIGGLYQADYVEVTVRTVRALAEAGMVEDTSGCTTAKQYRITGAGKAFLQERGRQ